MPGSYRIAPDAPDLDPGVEGGPLPLRVGAPPERRAELAERRLALLEVARSVTNCVACPRLVAWRELVAREKTARFAHETYWGRPLPGWGPVDARVLLVGLAPAAHGGNRTGRIFTGDRSGDFLFAALNATGFATRAGSSQRGDGLQPIDLYIAAVNRCAPPGNRPTPEERDRCLPYLACELTLLADVRAIVALGAFAWDGALRALAMNGSVVRPRPVFGHGAEARLGAYMLIGSFHPSQQNTFTGKLTAPMLEDVLRRAAAIASS